jgi:hypothetical protein
VGGRRRKYQGVATAAGSCSRATSLNGVFPGLGKEEKCSGHSQCSATGVAANNGLDFLDPLPMLLLERTALVLVSALTEFQ